MNSIPHCAIFAFPRMKKTYGVLRIADYLLSHFFPHKNWTELLPEILSEQSEEDSLHASPTFVSRTSEILFLPLELKIYIFEPTRNVLYIFNLPCQLVLRISGNTKMC